MHGFNYIGPNSQPSLCLAKGGRPTLQPSRTSSQAGKVPNCIPEHIAFSSICMTHGSPRDRSAHWCVGKGTSPLSACWVANMVHLLAGRTPHATSYPEEWNPAKPPSGDYLVIIVLRMTRPSSVSRYLQAPTNQRPGHWNPGRPLRRGYLLIVLGTRPSPAPASLQLSANSGLAPRASCWSFGAILGVIVLDHPPLHPRFHPHSPPHPPSPTL